MKNNEHRTTLPKIDNLKIKLAKKRPLSMVAEN
jgi:hypothetical protein